MGVLGEKLGFQSWGQGQRNQHHCQPLWLSGKAKATWLSIELSSSSSVQLAYTSLDLDVYSQ